MRESSRDRAKRIPRDYYRQSDAWMRWRVGLSALGVALVAAWWNFGDRSYGQSWPAQRIRAAKLATHGPLARVHATWEAECDACHVSARNLAGSRWGAPIVGDSRQSDAECRTCHAAPAHAGTIAKGDARRSVENPEDVPHCAECHRDHRGPDTSLVRLPDTSCTSCHADLSSHVVGGEKPAVAAHIRRFDLDHPEFAFLRGGKPDPGTVKFDHARHLRPGMTQAPAGGRDIFTYAQIPEPYRGFYERPENRAGDRTGAPISIDQAVRLDCAVCHRLDGSQVSGGGAVRGSGELMQPIRFETHCQACHPLRYDLGRPELTLRHGLQPAEVQQVLRQIYAAEDLDEHPDRPAHLSSTTTIPGKPERRPTDALARQAIEKKVLIAEKNLYSPRVCGKCHEVRGRDGGPAPSLDAWNSYQDARIDDAGVPATWLPNATFDHSAHRAADCRLCHERAYPDAPRASTRSADVLIPGRETCLACHSPLREDVTRKGGAGFSCTDCHRYHDGDHPLAGVGALSRGSSLGADLQTFLRGAK